MRLHENLCAVRNADLHGSAPDKSEVALILVDVINDLDFPEAKQLARFIPALADSIARLKRRAKAAGVPVIYVMIISGDGAPIFVP
jgi:nicotinamidase-related amidase